MAIAWLAIGCARVPTSASEMAQAPVDLLADVENPIPPLSTTIDLDPKRVEIGASLFADTILSGDGQVACTSCHQLDRGGADGKSIAHADHRDAHTLNTPSIFNVAYQYRYNWTAKFSKLEDQLDAVLANKVVMSTSIADVTQRIRESRAYAPLFHEAYADGVTKENVRDAITSYERSLVTPNGAFDRWRQGDEGALDEEEKQGYELFKSHGCISCHQGTNVGGNLVQRFGVMKEYFGDLRPPRNADMGRFEVTKHPEDRYVFRVPSLRNVALTAPYFHDGSAPTLNEAVADMAEYQLGHAIDPGDADCIVAFLKTLTGELPKAEP